MPLIWHREDNLLFGYPGGFPENQNRIVDMFQDFIKASNIKRVIREGQVMGITYYLGELS
ncbi:unnamed protein product [marine sediment metagenome]|uniref:Uncharacterized protein n=1 Tax=marine sediment metagenome TaxID=412755 RepID=X1VPK2_9ZZZZ